MLFHINLNNIKGDLFKCLIKIYKKVKHKKRYYNKMKRTGYISIFLIICLFGFASIPSTLESPTNTVEKKPSTSQPRPLRNYNMEVGYEYEWIDATGGTKLNLANNYYSYQYFDFYFPFYTAQHTYGAYVSENGFLGFSGMSTSGSANNQPFPITGQHIYNYLIAPFWDDIDTRYFGDVYVQSFGDHWVASWNNVVHRNWWGIGSFQVVLYQSGDIVFNYKSIGYVDGGYTCGLNYGYDPDYYSSYQGITQFTQFFSIRFTYTEEHDVSVALAVPTEPELGDIYNIEATISNVGLIDESNVELRLYLDDLVVQDITIPNLVQGASETINFMWTPTEFRTYNFTAYAPPIAGETFIVNNEITKFVTIYQNYTMVPGIPYNWIDASGGTKLDLDDDGFAEIPLGFDFPFYDKTFDTVYLGANGYLSFTAPPYDYTNDPIPSGDSDNLYLIAPFWDDVRTEFGDGGGMVYYQSFETEGYWVAEWVDVWHYLYPQEEAVIGTFQVILYQTGQIIFNYDYLDFTTDPYWEDGYTCGLNLGVDTRYYNSYQGLNDDTDDFSILFTRIIPAEVDFNPDTLNSKSHGKWVTVYIELQEGFSVNDIIIDSVLLNNELSAESHPTEIGDYDGDGIPDLMVKFNRTAVIGLLKPGLNRLITISGELPNGIKFEGTDEIRVL